MYKTLLTIAVLFAYTGIFGQRTTLPNTATQSPSNKNLNNVNGQLIQNRLVVNDSAWFNGVQNLFPNGQVGIGTVTPTAKLHVVSDSNLIRMVATFGSEIISILGGKNMDGTILNGFLVNHADGDDAASCLIGYNSNGDLTSRLSYESDTGANASVNALYGQILIEVNDDGGNNVILSVTDPEGVVIQGKNTSSLASALTVRQGDGTEVLEVRNDGQITASNLAGSAQKFVIALGNGTLDTLNGEIFTIDGNDNMYAGTDLDSLTSGVSNLVIGLGAGLNIADAINNTIIDAQVSNLVSGSGNVFVGKQIVATSDNSQSVAIGYSSTVDDLGVAIGYLAIAGEQSVAIGGGATDASFANSIAIGTVSTTAISQMVCGAINSVYFGNGVTNNSPFDITIHATGGNGTNATGADMLLAAGISTGDSEAGGQIQFLTSDIGASGTTPQTLSEKIAITKKGDLIINLETKGLVVFDGTNYWRLTNTAGVASFTDLGTSRPD